MKEFILKNEATGEEKAYAAIIDIVREFKEKEKYKIPNFLKESLKQGSTINITTPSGKYTIYQNPPEE
jgi:ferredoxin-NADP reductase